ncbi:glycosyltransferase family 4 protein [Agromyces seonyuensis]|uniref:Glycosyltransferase n=1 Tax=Agromyces seonyuensis TaxID=2662446 RepID=A0A6I4NXC7_9MICO|nr:glycosyltransferase family 1 protein [Agromyces seonyuensis]MWB98841.1 glycosyltransferase [Agromyces seonyuensis]
MTRVLVDLLFFTGAKGGMESYVRQVYSHIADGADDVEFVGLASRELAQTGAEWFPGRLVDSGISGEDRIAWARGELFAVPSAARRLGADVVHAPANLGPWRSSVPVVLTVHDLLPFVHPEWVPGPYAPVLRALVRGAARAASRILTISAATGADLESVLHIPASRITTVPLAGSVPSASAGPRRPDLLLAVGNRMPHKGFETLLEALARIPADRRPHLVVTGSRGEDPLAPVVARLGLDPWVDLVGWITAAELDGLYGSATALVFPTRFEGFGLPVLEAMSRGCPVLCSDLPVLREVGGDAAGYFDPTDPSAIARSIEALLADPDALLARSAAGLERSRGFDWARTAAGTRAALVESAR